MKHKFEQGETDYNNKYNNLKGNKYNGENLVQRKGNSSSRNRGQIPGLNKMLKISNIE